MKYPYYGQLISSPLVVYFTAYKSGVVIKKSNLFSTGELRTDWNEDNFIKISYPSEVQMLKKGDIIIGGIQADGSCSIAAKPVPHINMISAQKEAERLSKITPGKKFVVLEVKGICGVQQVVWE
jgi:hypothetical protein